MSRQRGISSIYGFIMIFLLSMASIQTWSSAVGAMESIQGASDQSHQLQQLQRIEHLSLSLSGGNLTIVNDGQLSSTIEFLRLVAANSSRTVDLNAQVEVGSSVEERVPVGYAIEAVTSLGNVFMVSPTSDPPGSVWSGPSGDGGIRNNQLFQNAYDPSVFYLSSGAQVFAFSGSGVVIWSFDAGVGVVTDVLPLSDGQVYVSVGYAVASNSAELYLLDAGGRLVDSFPVRLSDSTGPRANLIQQPVAKGADSGYVFYDGWFYSAKGPIGSISSDSSLLAATDSSDFYLYSTSADRDFNGVCQAPGNTMVFDSYSAGSGFPEGAQLNWDDYVFLGSCNAYPQQLLSASTGGGSFAALFADPYFSESYAEGYPGQNPYIVVISGSGQTIFQGLAPTGGCSAIATDGSNVYLALPQAREVQVVHISTDSVATYPIGIAASSLLWESGTLFAISKTEVMVYDGSMRLEKSIDLAPLALSSSSNSLPLESALQTPSFLVLNSTSYAVLAENGTGYNSLIIGRYA